MEIQEFDEILNNCKTAVKNENREHYYRLISIFVYVNGFCFRDVAIIHVNTGETNVLWINDNTTINLDKVEKLRIVEPRGV